MALQKTIEKDDLLTRMRVREVLLFGLIAAHEGTRCAYDLVLRRMLPAARNA